MLNPKSVATRGNRQDEWSHPKSPGTQSTKLRLCLSPVGEGFSKQPPEPINPQVLVLKHPFTISSIGSTFPSLYSSRGHHTTHPPLSRESGRSSEQSEMLSEPGGASMQTPRWNMAQALAMLTGGPSLNRWQRNRANNSSARISWGGGPGWSKREGHILPEQTPQRRPLCFLHLPN